jgi:hypothetical protein
MAAQREKHYISTILPRPAALDQALAAGHHRIMNQMFSNHCFSEQFLAIRLDQSMPDILSK